MKGNEWPESALDANLKIPMPGISGEFKKSLRNRTEQDVVEDSLIPKS